MAEELEYAKPDRVIETAQSFAELSKEDKVASLLVKYDDYPEYQRMSDSEKLDILITEHAEQLATIAIAEQQTAFFLKKDAAMKEHAEYEQKEIETTRVRVYKERLYLEQMWADAAATGEWKIPE